MYKVVLLSFLLVTLAAPIASARDRSARRGFKKMLVIALGFAVLYLLALLLVYPKLYYPVI